MHAFTRVLIACLLTVTIAPYARAAEADFDTTFSSDGKRLFALYDHEDAVLAWSVETGKPVDPSPRPSPLGQSRRARGEPGRARSPDGSLRVEWAKPDSRDPRMMTEPNVMTITDTRLLDPKATEWPRSSRIAPKR